MVVVLDVAEGIVVESALNVGLLHMHVVASPLLYSTTRNRLISFIIQHSGAFEKRKIDKTNI